MKKLLEDSDSFYKPRKRPSGHDISNKFGFATNGGAIPSNLLQFPNTDSNSLYLRLCDELAIQKHPARFPFKLPKFFIDFLTDENDLVVDIFAGSNTTGDAAEKAKRRWISCDLERSYLAASALRFFEEPLDESQKKIFDNLMESDDLPIDLAQIKRQQNLFFQRDSVLDEYRVTL
jgi:site-specific DNA-methyltransferase (cytosine-N4-specific)